uniref:Uncharacterized protein n=1 Tax=Pithovirus LCPAC302 TaxID=2506593 RepID=A0A481Z768_9VIRU|nr:MAG: hypothetical protein LCPAC302_00860 [Pithovirus LCPAC302]
MNSSESNGYDRSLDKTESDDKSIKSKYPSGNIYETTLNKQLRRLYLDQMERKKAQRRKEMLIKKWKCFYACCML